MLLRVVILFATLTFVFCDELERLSIQRSRLEKLKAQFVVGLTELAPKIPMEAGEEFDSLLKELDEVISVESGVKGLVASSVQLTEFTRTRPEIREVIETHQLSKWGTVRDLKLLSYKIKYEEIPAILEWIVESTPLESALDLAKEDNAALAEVIGMLHGEVSVALKSRRASSFDERMVTLAPIFAKYESTIKQLSNIAIGDFGTFEQFVLLAQNYHRISIAPQLFFNNSTANVVVSGEEDALPDATITEDLFDAIDDQNFHWNRDERKALGNLTVAIRTVTRARTFSVVKESTLAAFSQLIKRYPRMFERVRQIPIGRRLNFGTFGDLVDALNFEKSDKGVALIDTHVQKPIFLQAFDSSRFLMPTLLQDAIGDLSKRMESALEETTDLDTLVLALHGLLSEFLREYAFFEEKLRSIELGQWGTVRTLMDIGDLLKSKFKLQRAVTKHASMNADYDEATKSELVMDLQDALDNSTFKWTRSDRHEIEALIVKCENLSERQSFTENRNQLIGFYANLSGEMRERARSIPVDVATFGRLIDALYIDTISTNPPPTAVEEQNDVEATAAPPPPLGNGNCSNLDELLVNSDLGEAVLVTSLRKALEEWPIGTTAAFRTYLRRVEVILAHDNKALRPAIQTLATYAGHNENRNRLLKRITLGQWGTVEQLFIC